ENIKSLIPPYVYKTQDFFMRCLSCHKIYWQGTHWGNVKKVIRSLSSGL
ncbi:MAG: hypothetical protein JSW40_01105, partial [Candidatus Omnitrophota bacterium]